jgi:hypothetical protein
MGQKVLARAGWTKCLPGDLTQSSCAGCAHHAIRRLEVAGDLACMPAKESCLATFRSTLTLVAVGAAPSGCCIVPVRGPDGTVMYDHYPLPPLGSPMPMAVPPPTPAAVG